jgi:hypothetical protein
VVAEATAPCGDVPVKEGLRHWYVVAVKLDHGDVQVSGDALAGLDRVSAVGDGPLTELLLITSPWVAEVGNC